MSKKKVLIFELVDVNFASRSRKEAFTLAENGYEVTFLGVSKKEKKRSIFVENKVRLVAFPLNYSKKILNILGFNFQLFIFLLKNKFDIYHLHNLNSVFVATLFKIFTRRKLIFDAHELNYNKRHHGERLRNRLITAVDVFKERLLLLSSDVILQANDKRADLFAKHYRCRKPEVIENNEPIIEINAQKSIRNSIDIPPNQKILIFTGNITYGINQSVDKVIEALPHIKEELHFYLLGNASEYAKTILLNIAEKNKVKSRVHFLDPIPFSDVVHFISGADIAVIPIFATSLNSRFSALNKVSQSLMAGLPLATSNYENLEMLINNGKDYIGETFDVENPKSIAQAVNQLISQDLTKAKQAARTIAVEHVNWENEGRKLLEIYSKL